MEKLPEPPLKIPHVVEWTYDAWDEFRKLRLDHDQLADWECGCHAAQRGSRIIEVCDVISVRKLNDFVAEHGCSPEGYDEAKAEEEEGA